MKIQLSDHFTYKKLLRFTIPSIAMMIFTSIYGVVDGFFVSNFAGKTAFTAINFIMPYLMILGTLGFMLGAGGSAIVAKTMGEGKKGLANEYFSLIVYTTIVAGSLLAIIGIILIKPVAAWLGAEGEMLHLAIKYGRIILIALPAFMLQMEFQTFFITAEKPTLGLIITAISGIMNMLLDALLVGIIPLGLVGAALATAISQAVGGVIPIVYFSRKNSSILKLGKTNLYAKALGKACANGSSELMSNVSMSLVSMLYNVQLLNYAGEDGIAAYGVMMYVNMIFLAAFIGYSIGTAPVISFHFGADNKSELKNLLGKSVVITAAFALAMLSSSLLLATPLSKIFVSYDKVLLDLTVSGFRIFSISFLFAGFAIFGSSFFTALNDGITSAVISFLRTLVFQVAAVLILPLVLGIVGIWWSIVAAEFMAVVITICFVLLKKKKYGYL